MKIIPRVFSRNIAPILTSMLMMVPVYTAKEQKVIVHEVAAYSFPKILNSLESVELRDLKIVNDTNFLGGIIQRFDDNSVNLLKKRISRPQELINYKAPIENADNVYLEPFGVFLANRPGGGFIRPHMGLDIFVSRYAKKPKEPVVVQSVVDGIVISRKVARKEDNLIANMVTVLGVDGRRYAYDHLARPEDYSTSIPLAAVGTKLRAGDSIGYVGSTGETTMWHTHFVVMTDDKRSAQINSDFWQKYAHMTPYCKLSGQVNPLDSAEAGPIANLLNEYRGADRLINLSEEDFIKNANRKK